MCNSLMTTLHTVRKPKQIQNQEMVTNPPNNRENRKAAERITVIDDLRKSHVMSVAVCSFHSSKKVFCFLLTVTNEFLNRPFKDPVTT